MRWSSIAGFGLDFNLEGSDLKIAQIWYRRHADAAASSAALEGRRPAIQSELIPLDDPDPG